MNFHWYKFTYRIKILCFVISRTNVVWRARAERSATWYSYLVQYYQVRTRYRYLSKQLQVSTLQVLSNALFQRTPVQIILY